MPEEINTAPTATDTWAGRMVFAALIAVAAHLGWFVLRGDTVSVLNIFADDAAYYLQIARNAAAGLGFTFDSIHATNGFQPLWQWLLVPLAAVLGDDPGRLVRATLLVQIIMLTGASLALFRSLAVRLPGAALLPAAVIYCFFVVAQAVNGMESSLLLTIAALLAVAAIDGDAFRGERSGPQWLFGLGLGLAMLARLDAVFLGVAAVAIALGMAVADPARRSGHLRRAMRLVGGASLVVAPYLAFNTIRFGAPFPISAVLKSSFPAVSGQGIDFLTWRDVGAGALAFAWLAAAAVVFLRGRRRPRGGWIPVDLHLLVSALAVWVLLHLLNTVLFLDWAIFSWHFAHYGFFAAVAIAAVAAGFTPRLLRSRPSVLIYWVVMAAMFIAAGARLARRADFPTPNWHTTAYEGAVWARENTGPDTIFAMTDAGLFALFSGRRTINLDGIVNDRAFQDVLAEKRLGDYLRSNGVDFLVQHALFGRDDVLAGSYADLDLRFRSHLHRSWSEPLIFSDADEAYRSRFYRSGDQQTLLLVWRFDGKDGVRESVAAAPR